MSTQFTLLSWNIPVNYPTTTVDLIHEQKADIVCIQKDIQNGGIDSKQQQQQWDWTWNNKGIWNTWKKANWFETFYSKRFPSEYKYVQTLEAFADWPERLIMSKYPIRTSSTTLPYGVFVNIENTWTFVCVINLSNSPILQTTSKQTIEKRSKQLQTVFHNIGSILSSSSPVFLVGTFNDDPCKDALQNNTQYTGMSPSTCILGLQYPQYKDSFEKNMDKTSIYTWDTYNLFKSPGCPKLSPINSVLDNRVDFIFYDSKNLQIISSETIKTVNTTCYFPSHHFPLVGTYQISQKGLSGQNESRPTPLVIQEEEEEEAFLKKSKTTQSQLRQIHRKSKSKGTVFSIKNTHMMGLIVLVLIMLITIFNHKK